MDEKSLEKTPVLKPIERQKEEQLFTYKSCHIFEVLPSCTLDILYFRKLYEILSTSAEEGASIEIAKVNKLPGQTDEVFEAFKKQAKSLYLVTIQIFDAKGGYIFTESPSIFDESKLPDSITRIIFDNSQRFRAALQREPIHRARITFDFAKSSIFDFITMPSHATPNNSNIDIIGETETWVHGTYKKVVESLKERGNKGRWLHANNIYDIFLWFVVIPLNLRLLYKINLKLQANFVGMSTFLKVGIYLYFFVILLYVYRIIFNYARWIFPNIELRTSLQKGAVVHRLLLGTLVLGIATTFLYEIGKVIFALF
jgi:hypothetical protein